MIRQRTYQAVAAAVTLAGMCFLVAISLALTDGMLVYTLDDPYIHLAVAENILRGGYGVNAGEFSAPSSSILYPFLLAGLLAVGLGDWSPMLLAGFGSVLTAWLMSGALWRYAVAPGSWRGLAFAMLVLVPMLVAVNIFALPLTGMEHTLHMAATVAVVIGLYELDRDKPLSPWFLLAVILVPLIRYEGLALAVPAFFALLWRRKFAGAGLLLVLLAAIMGGFAYVLVQNGVPVLPSSVMVKSEAIASAVGAGAEAASRPDMLAKFFGNMIGSFDSREGTIFGFGIVILTLALSAPRSADGRGVVIWTVILALLGHSFVGHFGWFSRYEIYGMAMLITALILVFGDFWRDLETRFFFKTIGAAGFLSLIAGSYLLTTIDSPAASFNIYIQQYQMHRFATEFFPRTVAVNDLGYVTYRNDGHVLDLWGLGSEDARRATAGTAGISLEALDALVAARDAKYAMIYEKWYAQGLPRNWCRIAVLKTVSVSAAEADVAIYLIDQTLEAELNAALDAFAPTVPDPGTLDRFACRAP